MASALLIILIAALVLAVTAGIGILTLIKLGVITTYAFKDEPQDYGEYDIDQSHESGEK
jgi:hypothetical protein